MLLVPRSVLGWRHDILHAQPCDVPRVRQENRFPIHAQLITFTSFETFLRLVTLYIAIFKSYASIMDLHDLLAYAAVSYSTEKPIELIYEPY